MIWKSIDGFADYEISSTGQVKSKQRKILRIGKYCGIFEKKVNERMLKPAIRNGYQFVTLRKNNSHKANMIHHMVAEAFIGKRMSGLVINHINGIKTDNRAENLEYCSKSKNTQHYFNSIGKCLGRVPYSDIPAIVERINNGEEIEGIAEEYGVRINDISVINKIVALTGEELQVKL
jgi:hypothetical protein